MNRSSTLSLSYLPEVKRKKKSYLISSTVSAFNHMFPSKTPPTNPKSYSTSASVNDPSFSSCCVGFVISGFQVLHTINANVESEGPFTFTQSVKTGNAIIHQQRGLSRDRGSIDQWRPRPSNSYFIRASRRFIIRWVFFLHLASSGRLSLGGKLYQTNYQCKIRENLSTAWLLYSLPREPLDLWRKGEAGGHYRRRRRLCWSYVVSERLQRA